MKGEYRNATSLRPAENGFISTQDVPLPAGDPMQPFYWNRNFEIGIASVDRQHHQLVDLVNGLAEAMGADRPLPEIRTLTEVLMAYAVEHFTEEEALLAEAPMAELEKELHRAAHRGFVEKVQSLVQRPDLLQADIAQGVLDFLTTWLISHILGTDRKIAMALQLVPADPDQGSSLAVSPVERILLGALTETERRFRLLSDNTPSLIWVSDAEGVRGFLNRAWSDFLGRDMDDHPDRWEDHVHPGDLPGYLQLLESLITDPRTAQAEYRLRNRDGHDRWFFELILPRRAPDGTFLGLIASATDVTSLKEAEQLLASANEHLEQEVARRTAQLEHLMRTDPLTGVGNRRHLVERLEVEVERSRRYQHRLSVLFMDLDHFKRVNDSCGHPVGDLVLAAAAGHLRAKIRASDVLGRFGGEEFVVLMPDTPLDQARVAAERWLAGLPELEIPEVPWPITASGGVAEFQIGDTADSLLSRCDEALYRAKAEGRACVRVG